MTDTPGNNSSTAVFEGNPFEFATFSGEFETFGDSDWIRVTLVAGQTYKFYGSATSFGPNGGDAYMELRNSAGTIIDVDDDDGVGVNSLITFVPTTTGTYFLSIRSIFGDPGEYSVAVAGGTSFFDSQQTDGDNYSQLLAGSPRTVGGKGDDELLTQRQALGEQGDDTLSGAAGGSTLSGGTGNDSITGGVADDLLFGDSGSDYVLGGGGADRIYGGAGYDKLDGGTGFDIVHGGAGADYVGGGTESDQVFGDEGNDSLNGSSGDDTINGGTDADTMNGGSGSDTFYVDNLGDLVREYNETGTDRIYSTVSFDMRGQYAEILTLLGTANLKGTGNALGNIIGGNNGANVLNGMEGADAVVGGGGNDTITGGTGIDVLVGGAGRDRLIGGTDSQDFFRFDTAISPSNLDRIVDFKHGTDIMQLSHTIFAALGASVTAAEVITKSSGHVATTAAQRLIYDKSNGTVWYDVDGNKAGGKSAVEFAILGENSHPTSIDFHDFAII